MLDKISQALNDLSGAERKVAECALAEPKWFVHAAVAEIAELHLLSEAVFRCLVLLFYRTNQMESAAFLLLEKQIFSPALVCFFLEFYFYLR